MSYTRIQSATGSVGAANATSVTVSVSSTVSGNLLVAFVDVNGTASVTITPPSGWTQIGTTQGYNTGNGSVAMFYLNPASNSGGATSFVFSFSASVNAAVAFEEWNSSLGWAATALDVFVAQQNPKQTGATTGTTAALAGSGELAIFGIGVGATSILTYSSITNSYVEDTAANAVSSEATRAQATLFYNTNVGSAATSSGATMSGTGATGNTTILAVFKPGNAITLACTFAGTGTFAGTLPLSMSLFDVSAYRALITTRLNFMAPSLIRTAAPNVAIWCPSGVVGTYDFANSFMQDWYAVFDNALANNYSVIVAVNSPAPFSATSMNFATAFSDLIAYLINTLGYSNISYVSGLSEPDSNGATYTQYKTTIEPNLVTALAANNLANVVTLLGPDTAMAEDSWLTSASTDLSSTLGGYVRHAFPTGATDISNDSRETTVASLVNGILHSDPTGKPIIQGEMGFAYMGPGQAVASFQYGVEMADYAVQILRAGMTAALAYILDDDMHGTEWGMWQSTASTTSTSTTSTTTSIQVPRVFGGTIPWSTTTTTSTTTVTGPAPLRPWFFPWSLLCQTLVPGSTLYAPVQPDTNDLRVLASQSPQGAWTFVIVNRRTTSQQIQLSVPFAQVATTTLQQYVYSSSAPLIVDSNGFPLPSGTVQAVLARGFTVPMAANSVLFLSQQATAQTTIFDVKRPPLQKRR